MGVVGIDQIIASSQISNSYLSIEGSNYFLSLLEELGFKAAQTIIFFFQITDFDLGKHIVSTY